MNHRRSKCRSAIIQNKHSNNTKIPTTKKYCKKKNGSIHAHSCMCARVCRNVYVCPNLIPYARMYIFIVLRTHRDTQMQVCVLFFPQKKNLELNEGIIFGIECVPSLSQTHEHQPQDYHFFFCALSGQRVYRQTQDTDKNRQIPRQRRGREGGRDRASEGGGSEGGRERGRS